MLETASDLKAERVGGYRPAQAGDGAHPVFQWPPKPVAAIRWLFGFPGYLWPWSTFFALLAFLLWRLLAMDAPRSPSLGWTAGLLGVNLGLLILFAGTWHVRLYARKSQGTNYKYNSRWLSANNSTFLFNNQLWDNVFRCLVSAVPIWTAYELVTLWLFAHGYIRTVSWRAHPVYCLLLLLLIPMWLQVHFYAIHRLIHWGPLYRSVHYIHHKNANFGPWSGLAMHPAEHLLLFSGVMLLWIVPSTPIHALFLLLVYGLGPALDHQGFARVQITNGVTLNTDHYTHYLHHKYVNVNFGGDSLPIDRWLGTFHDGSDRAHEAMKSRLRGEGLR
jgi:sterol desaturase/sphingolipid hydroxylase (fatty acid hydroxylase superfamily)